MNNDQELLEKAAKAASLHVKGHRVDSDDAFTHLIIGAKGSRQRDLWNPLTDDGDALRLAVKLRLDIYNYSAEKDRPAYVDAIHMDGKVFGKASENIEANDDPYAATRRAIVHAAAAVWEAK